MGTRCRRTTERHLRICRADLVFFLAPNVEHYLTCFVFVEMVLLCCVVGCREMRSRKESGFTLERLGDDSLHPRRWILDENVSAVSSVGAVPTTLDSVPLAATIASSLCVYNSVCVCRSVHSRRMDSSGLHARLARVPGIAGLRYRYDVRGARNTPAR